MSQRDASTGRKKRTNTRWQCPGVATERVGALLGCFFQRYFHGDELLAPAPLPGWGSGRRANDARPDRRCGRDGVQFWSSSVRLAFGPPGEAQTACCRRIYPGQHRQAIPCRCRFLVARFLDSIHRPGRQRFSGRASRCPDCGFGLPYHSAGRHLACGRPWTRRARCSARWPRLPCCPCFPETTGRSSGWPSIPGVACLLLAWLGVSEVRPAGAEGLGSFFRRAGPCDQAGTRA